jgi:hypothetical protein
MMAIASLDLIRGSILAAALIAVPALAQSATERGVFVTQIGDGSRANVIQRNSDSFARIVQDGDENEVDLAQNGSAPHRATIAQDGDGNVAGVEQDGDGSTDLTLVQEGDANSALVLQREISAAEQSSAAILQRGSGNRVILAQNGSDNEARLEQLGDGNTMTATQLDNGNRLQWSQNGDNLADLGIVQTGGASLQVTQSNIGGVQFAPPPGGGGG